MGLRDQNPTYLKELKRTAMMAGISALVIGIGGTMYLNRSGKQVQSAAQVAAAQAAAVNETADQEYERRRLERTAAAGATWSPAPAAASTVQSSTADAKPPLAVTAEVRQPVAPASAAPVVQPPSARLPVEIAATATPRGDAPAVIVAGS